MPFSTIVQILDLRKTIGIWGAKGNSYGDTESDIIWISSHLILTSLESEANGTSNHLSLRSIAVQPNWIRNNWQRNPLNLTWISKSTDNQALESQNWWTANRLNLESRESQIKWFSNQMSIKAAESNQMSFKAVKSQSNSISTRLTVRRFEFEIHWHQTIWISNHWKSKQLSLKSIESKWIPHLLPIGSLSLETSAKASCGRYVINQCWTIYKQNTAFW